MNERIMKNYYKVFVLIFLSAVAVNVIADERNVKFEKNEEFENKLNAVANLLNKSTVSKQVLHSHNDAAVQYYRFSMSLYDEAVEAYQQGNINKSNELIIKSRAALIDAVEFANLKGEKRKVKSKSNYDSLRKSANALMDALERIDTEKKAQDEFKVLSESIKEKISASDKLYFKEQYDPAIAELSKVLLTIKTEISKKRSGDTLTRKLSFASAREEYIYELDRSDTHFMLLDMFLSENDKDKQIADSSADAIKTAKDLRKEAELLASNFKHKEAIGVLEKSTMEIIGVIRNTGVFIP
jgi:hypothetical protein